MGKTLPSLSEKYWECPILGLQKMPAWYSLYYIYNHDLIVTIKVNYLKSVLESINYKYFSYKYHLTPICQNVYIVFICNSINVFVMFLTSQNRHSEISIKPWKRSKLLIIYYFNGGLATKRGFKNYIWKPIKLFPINFYV